MLYANDQASIVAEFSALTENLEENLGTRRIGEISLWRDCIIDFCALFTSKKNSERKLILPVWRGGDGEKIAKWICTFDSQRILHYRLGNISHVYIRWTEHLKKVHSMNFIHHHFAALSSKNQPHPFCSCMKNWRKYCQRHIGHRYGNFLKLKLKLNSVLLIRIWYKTRNTCDNLTILRTNCDKSTTTLQNRVKKLTLP